MRRKHLIVAVIAAFALVAAACGSSDDTTTTTTAAASGGVDAGSGSDLSGSVIVSGSSTVEPITARVGEAFQNANTNVTVSVEGPGTGDGFAKFCAGETDISDASRAIKDEEAEICATAGIEWIELYVAQDGLSVITSTDNDAHSCLSFADMYAVVGPESTGFDTWADAASLGAEVGANPDIFIDQPLVITAPGEESGTFDTFVGITLGDLAEERGQDETTRPDYEASANDNIIIDGVAGSQYSFGWVGYAFAANNADQVTSLEVDGGDGCVAASEATIVDESCPGLTCTGTYPISRPLFIYINAQSAAEKPEVAAFVDYYLSDDGLAWVPEAGYVNHPIVDDVRANWEDRTTGRVFSES